MAEITDVIRASDQERELAAARLREDATAGRLSIEELATRLDAALAARTRGELDALFGDLPAPVPAATHDHHADARRHTRIYLLVCLAMIVLWAATGMGYFWPMWPIFGWGIGVVSHRAGCRAKSTRRGRRSPRVSSPSLPQA